MCNEQPSTISTIVQGGLRSIAASFPGFATIGQAWSEYQSHVTGRRIAELMENLKTRVDELSTTVDSFEERCQEVREEFPALLEIAIEKVRKEFSQEKRRIYANVLANVSLQQYQEPYEDKVSVLHSLDALNPQDIAVLRLFPGSDECAAQDLDWQSLDLQGDNNQKLAELASMLAKLESRGLIVTVRLNTGVTHVTPGLTPEIARLGATLYRVLPMGRRLLSALS